MPSEGAKRAAKNDEDPYTPAVAAARLGESGGGWAAAPAFIFGGANSANIRAYSRAYHTYFHSRSHCYSVNAFYVTLFVFPVNMWYTVFGVEELLRAQQCRCAACAAKRLPSLDASRAARLAQRRRRRACRAAAAA